jgi:nanoRNase/pAp phosphatase (c-di-AMP/oligoRNAs hydrolase)
MDIRPEYGSTCTILTEYFRECGVRMDRRIATGLFFGLKVDTANLTRNVHPADVEAYGWLLERIDENMLRSIEWTQVPQQTLDYFAIGLARRRTFGDVIVSNVGAVENPDVAVSVADFFIKVSGISIAVVWARAPDRIIVIFRSDGLSKNAGKVAKELFDAYGTAGGHRTMARAEILLEKVPELAPADETQTEHWLLRHLARVLHGVRKHWRPA